MLFRNEVYVTLSSRSGIRAASWRKHLMKLDKDSYNPYLTFRWMLVCLSLRLAMNWMTNFSAKS